MLTRKCDTELGGNGPAPGPSGPNPRRVAAGRANRAKWKGFTPEGLERLRAAALRHQPWRFATGPRTEAGKAVAARNGKKRQLGPLSVRELLSELADLRTLAGEMVEARRLVRSG